MHWVDGGLKGHSIEIEQFGEEAFLALLAIRVAPVRFLATQWGMHVRRFRLRYWSGRGAFDDLVEFAAVKPYAAALWAIVDFDTRSLGHYEAGSRTYRALHGVISFCGERATTTVRGMRLVIY